MPTGLRKVPACHHSFFCKPSGAAVACVVESCDFAVKILFYSASVRNNGRLLSDVFCLPALHASMSSPYEAMMDQCEAYNEMISRTPEQQAAFDAEIARHEQETAALEARFTFDGNKIEWRSVCEATDALLEAQKALSTRCWGSNTPPTPKWKEEAHELISKAATLAIRAQSIIEANPC